MVTFWTAFALVAIVAIAVTTYNIVDGIRKMKDEMKRMEYYESKSKSNGRDY